MADQSNLYKYSGHPESRWAQIRAMASWAWLTSGFVPSQPAAALQPGCEEALQLVSAWRAHQVSMMHISMTDVSTMDVSVTEVSMMDVSMFR